MKAADTAAGKRLVDYLDLHWYPEATGGGVRITGTDTAAAVAPPGCRRPGRCGTRPTSRASWITDPAVRLRRRSA